MRALMYKDFTLMLHGSRIFLLALAVFACIPSPGFVGFALIYAAMLPYQAFAYDERSKWDTLAAMMPYTPRTIVMSKYAVGWLSLLACSILCAVSRAVQLLAGRTAALDDLLSILPITGLSLLVIAVALPLTCRFGVEKGRLFFILLLVLSAVGIVSLAPRLTSLPGNEAGTYILLGALCVGGLIAQPISIAVACRLYRLRFYERNEG